MQTRIFKSILGTAIVAGGLGLGFALASTVIALAYDAASPSPVNVDAHGVGLRGHDPVA